MSSTITCDELWSALLTPENLDDFIFKYRPTLKSCIMTVNDPDIHVAIESVFQSFEMLYEPTVLFRMTLHAFLSELRGNENFRHWTNISDDPQLICGEDIVMIKQCVEDHFDVLSALQWNNEFKFDLIPGLLHMKRIGAGFECIKKGNIMKTWTPSFQLKQMMKGNCDDKCLWLRDLLQGYLDVNYTVPIIWKKSFNVLALDVDPFQFQFCSVDNIDFSTPNRAWFDYGHYIDMARELAKIICPESFLTMENLTNVEWIDTAFINEEDKAVLKRVFINFPSLNIIPSDLVVGGSFRRLLLSCRALRSHMYNVIIKHSSRWSMLRSLFTIIIESADFLPMKEFSSLATENFIFHEDKCVLPVGTSPSIMCRLDSTLCSTANHAQRLMDLVAAHAPPSYIAQCIINNSDMTNSQLCMLFARSVNVWNTDMNELTIFLIRTIGKHRSL